MKEAFAMKCLKAFIAVFCAAALMGIFAVLPAPGPT